MSSIFSQDTIEFIESLDTNKKNNKWLILNSPSWIKGTEDAITYAKDTSFIDFHPEADFLNLEILQSPNEPIYQSSITNIRKTFGRHMFKEGSVVIPGSIEYDNTYFSAKVNDTHLGIDVSVYLSNIIASNGGKGLRVRGQTSGIVATIKNFILHLKVSSVIK